MVPGNPLLQRETTDYQRGERVKTGLASEIRERPGHHDKRWSWLGGQQRQMVRQAQKHSAKAQDSGQITGQNLKVGVLGEPWRRF